MIYELRIYYIHPGKMGAICNRFQNHTLEIFPRHGIVVTDFWTDASGKEILYYVCEFESLEAKTNAWASFSKDPEWVEVKSKSEEPGPIVMKIESFVMEKANFWQ